MSIIAALDCDDYIALASDSLVTEERGLRTTTDKTESLPGRPFAWGFSGDEGIGRTFSQWMRSWQWPESATWDVVSNAAIEELSRLNGRRRDLALIARAEPKPDDLTTVLLAGYVQGAPDIFELTDRGGAASVKHMRLAAIGSGHAHAYIAYQALARAHKVTPGWNVLGFVVELAAHMAPMCSPPIRIIRIDPEGTHDPTTRAKPQDDAAKPGSADTSTSEEPPEPAL